MKVNGHTIYVFTAKLSSKRAISFQNLTIDEGPDQTLAFINTYTPTKKWINDWKKGKGKAGKFEGDISVVYLKLDNTTNAAGNAPINGKISAIKNTNSIANAQGCNTTTYYYEVPYFCGSGNHGPGDPRCVLTGEDAAGYTIVSSTVTECDPNHPGGGGGGGTSPTPPGDYAPCEGVPQPASAIRTTGKVMSTPPTECDPVVPQPTKDIRNKTTDPCISKTIEEVLGNNNDIEGILADIIRQFDASKSITINIFDGVTSSGAPGQYQGGGFIGNVFQANITLQTSYFQSTSKESVIATVIHEFVHAYIHTSGNLILEAHHDTMSSKYITPMAIYLNQTLGTPLKDAYALAWSGVPDSKAWKEASMDFEFTMSNGNKITKAETGSLSGLYKLATNDPSNNGFAKGVKICD